MKISIQKNIVPFLLLFVSSFFLSYYVRCIFIKSSIVEINILAILGLLYLYYKAAKGKKLFFRNINFLLVIISCLTVLYFLVFVKSADKSIATFLKYYFSIILPIPLIFIKIKKNELSNRVFIIFRNTINILVGIMLFMLIVDIFTGNRALAIFGDLCGNENIKTYVASRDLRHASIIGHYIPTAEIYIIYYILHAVEMSKDKKILRRNIFYMLVAIVGIGFTGSKSGIFIIICIFLIYNIDKFSYIISGILMLFIAYISGLFDLVINRILSTSLTTGRVEQLMAISSRFDIFPILGSGPNSSFKLNNIINWASAAFEFPFIMFCYEYGVIFSIIFTIVVFIYPILLMLKQKNYILVSLTFCLVVFVNTYNGIGIGYDYLYMFCCVIFVILNFSATKVDEHRLT